MNNPAKEIIRNKCREESLQNNYKTYHERRLWFTERNVGNMKSKNAIAHFNDDNNRIKVEISFWWNDFSVVGMWLTYRSHNENPV